MVCAGGCAGEGQKACQGRLNAIPRVLLTGGGGGSQMLLTSPLRRNLRLDGYHVSTTAKVMFQHPQKNASNGPVSQPPRGTRGLAPTTTPTRPLYPIPPTISTHRIHSGTSNLPYPPSQIHAANRAGHPGKPCFPMPKASAGHDQTTGKNWWKSSRF